MPEEIDRIPFAVPFAVAWLSDRNLAGCLAGVQVIDRRTWLGPGALRLDAEGGWVDVASGGGTSDNSTEVTSPSSKG